jgi:hypothetical protein
LFLLGFLIAGFRACRQQQQPAAARRIRSPATPNTCTRPHAIHAQGRAPSIPLERHRSGPPGNGALASLRSGDWDDDKYARRAHPLRRTMQRLLPGLFSAGSLPVTMRCGRY